MFNVFLLSKYLTFVRFAQIIRLNGWGGGHKIQKIVLLVRSLLLRVSSYKWVLGKRQLKRGGFGTQDILREATTD